MTEFRHHHCRGLTLVELVMATAAMSVLGVVVFTLLHAGLILFAKNTAVNVAHQQARVAVLTMEHDIHSAVSIPQLVDANRVALASGSTAPAAGIAFQLFVGGPFEVVAVAASGQNQIRLNTANAPAALRPAVGQRLNLSLHQTELIITAVSAAGSANCLVTLESTLPRPVDVLPASAFTSERYAYVVSNGQLRYFRPGDTTGRVLVSDITSPTPFSIPATATGTPYNRFVAAINLSTADHSTSNRGFRSANMFLNAMVPYRAKLCNYQ